MRRANPAQAAPEAVDLRQRAATSRDAAGRFIGRAPLLDSAAAPDPALAVTAVFRASWDALNRVLDAEVPDALSAPLNDAQGRAYDDLRNVRPTTSEGYRALAECWAMVLQAHRGDEPGVHVGDHAADSLIAGAGVCVPTQPINAGILGQVDLASASLVELSTIREKMYALSDMAYGLATQECCRADRSGPLADPHNAAGALMHWLADQLRTVEDRAGAEMLRRRPTDFWSRRTRLAAVAERVIMNGDAAKTAALIQDIQAFAAEQAEH